MKTARAVVVWMRRGVGSKCPSQSQRIGKRRLSKVQVAAGSGTAVEEILDGFGKGDETA